MPGGGGSSSANDIRAGGAYVDVYARDKLTSDLKAISENAKAEMAKLAADTNAKLGKISGSLSAGVKAGAAAVGLGGLVEASKTVFEMAAGFNKFNAEMDKGVKLTARVAEAQDKLRADVFDKIGGKSSFEPGISQKTGSPIFESTESRRAFLESQLAVSERSLKGVGDRADKANKEVTDLNGGMFLIAQRLPFLNDLLEVERREAKEGSDAVNEQRNKLREHVAALREQLRNIGVKGGKEFFEGANTLTGLEKELNFQLRTVGMTADQARILRAEMEGTAKGVKDAADRADALRGKLAQVTDKQNLKGMQDDVEAFGKDLQMQIKTFDMSPEEAQLTRLMEGKGGFKPDDMELADIRVSMEVFKAMKEQKEAFENAGWWEDIFPEIDRLVKGSGGSGFNLSQQLGVGDKFAADQQFELMKEANGFLREIRDKPELPAIFQ